MADIIGTNMSYTAKQLCDIEAIKDVAKRYSQGIDRLDVEKLKSAYWPDATDEHGSFVGNGHQFAAYCMTGHLKWRSTSHCIFNHFIELNPDGLTATGEVYNVSYLFQKDANVLDTWHGRYLDQYEKRESEWRMIHRVCVHEGTKTESIVPMELNAESFRQGTSDRNT
jgi:hypothetical protein